MYPVIFTTLSKMLNHFYFTSHRELIGNQSERCALSVDILKHEAAKPESSVG